MNDTTRTFSRTLGEAFPPEVDSGIEYTPASTIFSENRMTISEIVLWVISVVALCSLMFAPGVMDWMHKIVRMLT